MDKEKNILELRRFCSYNQEAKDRLELLINYFKEEIKILEQKLKEDNRRKIVKYIKEEDCCEMPERILTEEEKKELYNNGKGLDYAVQKGSEKK